MWVDPTSAFCANPSPMPHQQSAAKEVRPHLHTIKAPLVVLWTNPNKRDIFDGLSDRVNLQNPLFFAGFHSGD
jgi:hypothetical protein